METVPLSTGASSSSSRLLVRRANTPWRPEQEQVHRPWALVGPGVCLSAAWLRRHQRRAAGQAEAAKPKSSSAPAWGQLPCWGVAIFGLLLVIVHRLILQKCRLHLPPTRFTVFLHASLFLTMSQVLPPSKFPQEQNVKLVLLVGVLEFLGWASLQKVAVAGGLGVSAALLSGVSLMLTLASAQVLLKSRVRSSAWVGATLVALGVGALGPLHALTALSSHATSLLLLCASLGTTSLALTGKEVLFSGRAPLSVASVASLASFAQLLALAVPEMLRLHSFPGTLEMAQIIIGPAPRIAHLSWVAYAYILGSAALRYTFTWALRAANAPTVQLMNALAVPLGQILLMLTSNVALSWHSLASLGLCAVGGVIFLEEGPLVKASELFKGTMSEHQLRLEEAWKKQKAEKEKKAQEERERQKKLAQEREEKNKKEREVAEKQRLAKQQALQKEREEKEKQKEEERKKQEAERQKVAAEKKRLQEEQKAKKAEEKKKAEEERLKKQQEYQRMKQEEEKKAIAEKERKEAEKKQQAEAKQREREAQQKAKEEKRKQQELLAEQKKAEAAKKKEAEQKRQAEDAKKAQEMKQAEEERKRKEQEEKKKKQEEEAAQKKEAERQRQLAEEQTKQMEAEKKEKEEADRKRKEEEEQKAKAEQKAEAERKRQEEERKRQEQEQKQKQDEEGKPKQEVAEAKDLDQKKRFERLSFKWKMQDEMRLGQETAKIKKQLQEREEELAKLRESKEEEARRWKELEEEARKIEEEKTKAFQKKR